MRKIILLFTSLFSSLAFSNKSIDPEVYNNSTPTIFTPTTEVEKITDYVQMIDLLKKSYLNDNSTSTSSVEAGSWSEPK